MSRIYEALQKAESERKQDIEESGSRSLSGVDRMNGAAAVATVEYEAAPVFAEPGEEKVAAEAAEALPERGGLNPAAISQLPWATEITRLPALLDRGPAVEQFRSLRSRVYEARDVRPLKSILVSSGLPQEGKSFISANLALSLARHKNSKVLLIDGDMRRYTLHELLGTESHPGLADYLSGKAAAEEVMQRPQEIANMSPSGMLALANLTFIPGGNGGDKAADLSSNSRFGELLRQAESYFDWIIIDSSPVLPVSDAVNMARFCDAVLLVARAAVTKYPVAQKAAAEMRAANVLGFVLNAVPDNPQVGNYYGYNANKD